METNVWITTIKFNSPYFDIPDTAHYVFTSFNEAKEKGEDLVEHYLTKFEQAAPYFIDGTEYIFLTNEDKAAIEVSVDQAVNVLNI